jgi:cytoskeletal protein CcmA (bactofilin family)
MRSILRSAQPGTSTCLFLTITLLFAQSLIGQTIIETNRYTLAADQELEGETWVIAEEMNLSGDVRGELFVLQPSSTDMTSSPTQSVFLITGHAYEDVWGMARAIEVSGTVDKSVRLHARESVTISGSVGNNLLAYATPVGAVNISTGAVIKGNALIKGQNVIIEGHIDGNISAHGTGTLQFGGVCNNLILTSPKIDILESAVIKGDLRYHSKTDVVPAPGATIEGQIIRLDDNGSASEQTDSHAIQIAMINLGLVILTESFQMVQVSESVSRLILGFAVFLVSLFIIGIFPDITTMSVQRIRKNHFRSLLTGMAMIWLLPTLSLLLFYSSIGAALAIFILAVWIILIFSSQALGIIILGTMIVSRKGKQTFGSVLIILLVGIAVFMGLSYLPMGIGMAIILWLTFIGSGGLTLGIIDRRNLSQLYKIQNDIHGNRPSD